MDLSDLKMELTSMNLYPIEIEGSISSNEIGRLFRGNLQEYIKALKKLGHSAVFLATNTLSGDDFFYETGNEELKAERIDLRLLNPSLNKFENNLNQIGTIRLFSSLINECLDFYIEKEWWTEFTNFRNQAIEKVENQKAQKERGKKF